MGIGKTLCQNKQLIIYATKIKEQEKEKSLLCLLESTATYSISFQILQNSHHKSV